MLGAASCCAVLAAAGADQARFHWGSPGARDPGAEARREVPVKTSIPLWTDKPPRSRGKPPYTPPAGWVYNTSHGPVPGKINVHLVPHTHDDTGWQVSVDQYFYREVYYVLDTVIPRLAEDPNRRFIYVETGFFARWWDQQPDKKKALARTVVERGQLEFINGGWCMHDEASPYYVEMVDQTTRGHQFLLKNFGNASNPRGTWQIDPFGHSNTNAWLLGAESGMESLFWGRMDYEDHDVRRLEQRLEWVWEGSPSIGSAARIFSGSLYGSGRQGYGTFFNFDGANAQVQDDPTRHDYNVDFMVDKFVLSALEQDLFTRTDHQMWACGEDFNYQNADHWFHNLDKLIHYVNLNGSVNAFYSTPTRYVDEKKKAGLEWEVRKDDIFPLADAPHNYWSGYFTSRPALKRQVRFASNFLNAARQLETIAKVPKSAIQTPTTRPSPPVGDGWTDSLEGTIGVATHHDGMSGTERQSVSNDYELRISESHGEVEDGVALSLARLMGLPKGSEIGHCNCNAAGGDDCLNITMCAATTGKDSFTMAAWNPLGQPQTYWARLPVSGASWGVTDLATKECIDAQVEPIDSRTLELPLLYLNTFGIKPEDIPAAKEKIANKATHVLSFSVAVPAVGFASVRASAGAVGRCSHRPSAPRERSSNSVVVGNDYYRLEFDTATVQLKTITNVARNLTTTLNITWGWYNSSVGGCTDGVLDDHIPFCPDNLCDWACSKQKSGAYMFRPNSSNIYFPGPATTPTLKVVEGAVYTEVQQVFSSWVTHVIRLYRNAPFVEVEWTVGPIPVDTPWMPAVAHDAKGKAMPNNWGKEVVVRYSSGLKSDKTFYTDSNGRDMVRRQVDKRGPSYPPFFLRSEPVAGNYYPVNSMLAINDEAAGTSMVVVTDVSQGGTSLRDGQIELMAHRRVQDDDSRGVQEPLNETMCGCNDINAAPGKMGEHGHLGDGGCTCEGLTMRGKHWLVFDDAVSAAETRRTLIERLNFPPTLAFTSSQPKTAAASLLSQALPANVKLMTLTRNYESTLGGALLRLAHLYGKGEHPTLSQPVTVSLAAVFGKAGLKVTSAREVSVTANQPPVSETSPWKTAEPQNPADRRAPFDPSDPKLTVTLRPMDVRTFVVSVE